jgi:peptide/nickel transport system substrate-binding protein
MTQGLLPDPGTSVSAATPQACDDSAAAEAIPPYDPQAAAALLDEAGWVPGDDGIRERDGQRLTLGAAYNTAWPGAAAAVELVADAWKQIGVEAEITPLAQPDYIQKIQQTGDFDVIAVQQFSNPFPSTLIGMLAGPPPPDGMNAAHFDNPAYKEAVEAARVATEGSGCDLWTEASTALFENVDMIPIAQWPTNWVLNGAEMDALGGRPIATSIRVLAG